MGGAWGTADGPWVGRGSPAHPIGWRLRTGVRLTEDGACDPPVLLHPEGVLLLNERSAAVLRLCDGSRGAGAITAALSAEFAEVAAEQVLAFLAGIAEQGLIEGVCLGERGGG
ncbi:pyrroloquinoline quinone biosynthesis peptide chaperone PqqD [Kitasatospora viridis]|uniref:Coenzyme PQQ biosynthesis protein PqqD n=1 Tax=Kitasatospora viridis TaxID=281105 RepID=A0A561SF64_9ACTN|nr:pyrroloquinoline quinone biosynthesis peptide chaperone PqqD [Kitasatospora viridis]TWF73515.1 coenzyme PQQ biosynthesis protein PqqD [Kitasatospora viridis]